jgi:hypothetical protein
VLHGLYRASWRLPRESASIGAEDWGLIGRAQAFEPRPGALFVRPADVAAVDRGGPGSARGEAWRAVALYNSFPLSFITLHFARAYILGSYIPGSTLAPAKLAFQRNVLDQAALMLDPRAPERFARIEEQAQKERGQSYWWRPGRASAERAPQLSTALGR